MKSDKSFDAYNYLDFKQLINVIFLHKDLIINPEMSGEEDYDYANDYEPDELFPTDESNDDCDLDKYLQMKRQYSKSYTIVQLHEMENLRNKLIKDCMEFTYTTKEEATLIMINFQWNISELKDKWYNDVENNRTYAGIDLSKSSQAFLKSKKIKQGSNLCNVCESTLSDKSKLSITEVVKGTDWKNYYMSLSCNHNFCCECWLEYVNSKLDDVFTILTASCPQFGCNLIIPENAIFAFVATYVDAEKLAVMNKAILKNFTDRNKDMRWCPYPNCGVCVRSLAHYGKEIECECGNVFCFSCGKEGHRPCQCEMINAWEIKNNSESENVKWLVANTKQCPQCKKFIEKNQGCNHMTCRKEVGGCGYEFCWICLGEWKPHGSEYYKCNSFDPEKAKNTENVIKIAKFELAKYSHYFSRYANHLKSKDHAIKLSETIKNHIKNFINLKKLPLEELTFLNSAIETVIKVRTKLKNTYVFGYYLIECKEKGLFEHQQNLLEKNGDLLQELLEGQLIESMLSTESHYDFNKKFYEFKSQITNLNSATNNYMANLIDDIETRMNSLVDFNSIK